MPLLIVALTSLFAAGSGAPVTKPANATAPSANAASVEPAHAQRTTDDAEPPQTPEQKAARAAYQEYMRSLVQSLRNSTSARDRVLATQMGFVVDYSDHHEPTSADRADRGARLRAAAEAAPDDALVQWFWANAGAEDTGCDTGHPCPHRAEAALRSQPGNGVAWVPALNVAWQAKDTPATESALSQMARATHFDDQIGAALKAWMDVYARYPMPSSAVVKNSPEAKLDDRSRNFAGAMGFAVATAMPAYQSLVQACSRDEQPVASPSRFRDCAQVGRLMLMQSTSLISRMIGRAVLRVSGQATAADIANARIFDWQYERQALISARSADDASDIKALAGDWLDTGDEAQVMQRQLQRAGIPLTPPANWQPHGRDGKPINPLGEVPASVK